jgi:hypothetical protein
MMVLVTDANSPTYSYMTLIALQCAPRYPLQAMLTRCEMMDQQQKMWVFNACTLAHSQQQAQQSPPLHPVAHSLLKASVAVLTLVKICARGMPFAQQADSRPTPEKQIADPHPKRMECFR